MIDETVFTFVIGAVAGSLVTMTILLCIAIWKDPRNHAG
jgi:hypothetical protein